MRRTELAEILRNGENSGIEFKRDDVRPDRLAAEMAALLNLEGGRLLLGVEDGSVSGLMRAPHAAEEWVMQAGRDHVQPAVIPYWETLEWRPGVVVGVISLPADAPDKPYKARRGSAWVTRVRVGTITRDATREEEERLYQQSGRLRYGLKPVSGAGIDTLDSRRLRDYFTRVLGGEAPPADDNDQWRTLLCNLDLATEAAGHVAATIDGMLLFGRDPRRHLPQSGVRALCFAGPEPDYAARPRARTSSSGGRSSAWARPTGRWSSRASPTRRGTSCGATPCRGPGWRDRGASTAGSSRRPPCARRSSTPSSTATTASPVRT